MQYFILSQTIHKKASSVDCVTAVWLILIIDACLEVCWVTVFKFQIIQGMGFFVLFFFHPSCSPVGRLQQSSKSHNIWIATYHTQARKKLNLHSLRWMLWWSAHFAFQTHYSAVLLCLSCAQRLFVQLQAWATFQEGVLSTLMLFQWLSSPRWRY